MMKSPIIHLMRREMVKYSPHCVFIFSNNIVVHATAMCYHERWGSHLELVVVVLTIRSVDRTTHINISFCPKLANKSTFTWNIVKILFLIEQYQNIVHNSHLKSTKQILGLWDRWVHIGLYEPIQHIHFKGGLNISLTCLWLSWNMFDPLVDEEWSTFSLFAMCCKRPLISILNV